MWFAWVLHEVNVVAAAKFADELPNLRGPAFNMCSPLVAEVARPAVQTLSA